MIKHTVSSYRNFIRIINNGNFCTLYTYDTFYLTYVDVVDYISKNRKNIAYKFYGNVI